MKQHEERAIDLGTCAHRAAVGRFPHHHYDPSPLSIHFAIFVLHRSRISHFTCDHSAFSVTISCMTSTSPAYGRNASAVAMFLFPLLFIVVFAMHFQHPSDFFHFRLHYAPRDPVRVVTSLVRAQNRWPLFADPHMIGYLGLPLLPLCAYALYTLGRTKRPLLSGIALFITVAGTIFLGGILGMWTASYRRWEMSIRNTLRAPSPHFKA